MKNMKLRSLFLAVLTLCVSFVSCAEKETEGLVPEAPAEGVGGTWTAASGGSGEKEAAAENAPQKEKIDVDLTVMNSTMVYSEVYNMLSLPDEYLGKTVRMEGEFQCYPGEGRNYYVVLIADATACCQQGMEFVLSGEHVYPDDYPEPGTVVTVTGVFDTYYENEYMRFAQLIDASMTY